MKEYRSILKEKFPKARILILSDGEIEGDIFCDEARIAEIAYESPNHGYVIVGIIVDGKEYPIFSPNRLVMIDHCYSDYVVFRTDKWSIQTLQSSSEYIGDGCGGVSWKETLDILEDKVFVDALMNEKQICALKSEAEFAKKAKEALNKVLIINNQGGPGSRRAVRQIIEGLL